MMCALLDPVMHTNTPQTRHRNLPMYLISGMGVLVGLTGASVGTIGGKKGLSLPDRVAS